MLGEGTWSRRILIAAAVLWYQSADFIFFSFRVFAFLALADLATATGFLVPLTAPLP
jgi:hypothetical protein